MCVCVCVCVCFVCVGEGREGGVMMCYRSGSLVLALLNFTLMCIPVCVLVCECVFLSLRLGIWMRPCLHEQFESIFKSRFETVCAITMQIDLSKRLTLSKRTRAVVRETQTTASFKLSSHQCTPISPTVIRVSSKCV